MPLLNNLKVIPDRLTLKLLEPVLAGLEAVDFITIFSQNTPIELITNIKPNIHVKGGDYKKETLPEYPVVKGYGGQVIIQPFLTGFSTTSIIDQSRQS